MLSGGAMQQLANDVLCNATQKYCAPSPSPPLLKTCLPCCEEPPPGEPCCCPPDGCPIPPSCPPRSSDHLGRRLQSSEPVHDSATALREYLAAHAADAPAPPQAALDACTEDSVPILRMLRRPCDAGFGGYGCNVRWDLQDRFLPLPRRWLRQWNATTRAPVDCQRAFFAAFAAALTRAHWEQEWDAQPYRIAAVPPRTMGKMIHQLVTANYYHLTLGPAARPPLRSAPAPGSHFRRLPQPGFRWNILDYGGGMAEEIDYKRLTTMAGNVFSRPLSTGKRCAGVRGAWHCLWQRFPQQDVPPSPRPGAPLAQAATALYNLSLAGRRPDGLVQYLTVSGVTDVFTQVRAASPTECWPRPCKACSLPPPLSCPLTRPVRLAPLRCERRPRRR